jgi:hypothetical protein
MLGAPTTDLGAVVSHERQDPDLGGPSSLPLVFSTEAARALGYTDDQIRHRRASGRWVAIRRGLYSSAEQWARFSRTPGERHVLEILAALHRLPNAVAGFWSAGLLHGLPGPMTPLTRVHLIAGRGSPRRRDGIILDIAQLSPEHVVEDSAFRATTVARTVVDLARRTKPIDAVPVADAALARGLATREQLHSVLRFQAGWPGRVQAAKVIDFADPRSESPLESRSRVCFEELGLPTPELQVEICDEAGAFLARTDFLWKEHGIVGEADGKAKYAQGTAHLLWNEKRREDAIRRLGWEVFRWTLSEIEHQPKLVAERFWRFADLAARRRR